jgi:arginine exporter protein ArgO
MNLALRLLNKGNERTHALVAIVACGALSLALLILAVAAFRGRSVAGEISTVCIALGGLIGWVYKTGKAVEGSPGVVDGGKP